MVLLVVDLKASIQVYTVVDMYNIIVVTIILEVHVLVFEADMALVVGNLNLDMCKVILLVQDFETVQDAVIARPLHSYAIVQVLYVSH